ncbi:MAG TPA: LytTR family DNA-binding domain-containing protein [Anaeromyxobacteraceae bacterium]|nr:LytTR family DNA-binding domain-containing protein [Anaeromyxobacteraceae bacterium]
MPGDLPAAIRVLVVDDEPLAREIVRDLIAKDPDVELVGECATGAEAVKAIRRLAPDVVFLDVQMPLVDGFGVLEALRERAPAIVFVTAHSDHALRAFDVRAIDYLLKPFDDERFARALDHAKTSVRQARAARLAARVADLLAGEERAPAAGQARFLERITVRERNGVRAVPVAEIDWIGAQDYYAELHAGGESHLVREPLRDLERRLDPRRFVRVHRSAIVNVDRIRKVERSAAGPAAVLLKDGTSLPVSRPHRKSLLARVSGG